MITLLEIAKLKTLVVEIDESAFATISDVHDVMGGTFRKKGFTNVDSKYYGEYDDERKIE